MNMQENKRKLRLSLLVLVLLSSLFLITSSGNSMAWETYKADYWQTGNMFQDIGKFDKGYQTLSIGIGSDYLPLSFENPDVSNKTILVLGSSTGLLYALHEVSDIIVTIDTISAGDLIGQLGGFDKEVGDGKFEVAGIFDNGSIDSFKVFEFNGTDWSLMYNFTPAKDMGSYGIGITCREYNSADYCVFIDNNGTLYEVNIDTKSYTSHSGLGSLNAQYGVLSRIPVVESIRSDGTYQAIFHSDWGYGAFSDDLVSWDLTNDQLDQNFGGLGGDPVGVVLGAYDSTPAYTPIVVQIGVSCSWFLGLVPYNCQEAGDLELYGWGGHTTIRAHLWDSSGAELDRTLVHLGTSTYTAGNIGLMDCNDDGRLDLVAQTVRSNSPPSYSCDRVYCFDGYDDLNIIGDGSGLSFWDLNQAMYTQCWTGIALADLDSDGDVDIATSSGAFDTNFVDNEVSALFTITAQFNQPPIIADFNDDSLLDIIYTKAGSTVIYFSNATNDNPQFIGDGTEVDTCVPLCLNATMTFYARQDLDYIDDEGDNAYLGVDCYGLGFSNITWSSIATDPEVSCIYNSLGYWSVPVYISDSANFPSYSETQSFGIYTSLGASCYDTGEWQEECDPVTEVDEVDECFTDSGISICLVEGVSSSLCDECGCYDVPSNKCPIIVNGTVVDAYESVMFDWTQCADWEDSMWYGACPLFVWITSLLGTIWNWIFGAFWIFLTLLLVIIIVLLMFKKK